MSRRGKKPKHEDSHGAPSHKETPKQLSRRKLWAFRIAAAVGIPLLMLVLLELSLRAFGFGYETSFLLTSAQRHSDIFIENNRFGWRFFGPKLARSPDAFCIPADKSNNVIRIFVFGESAAFGDPKPEYGLPRMLQAMLSLRHPDKNFEVINAAMTGINSHAVREIAADCAHADGDVWVVYMGNNEVVGPFGAGTVFGKQTPSLPLIRATLALKATRTGQLLDRLLPTASATDARNWGGMEMFVKNQVRRDDPRMKRVYEHFGNNLNDIIKLGRQQGVAMVVSTIAVNLLDCAPFASATAPALSAEKKTTWDNRYQDGIEFQQASRWPEAAEAFAAAAQIDDSAADLHFRWGHALLEAGDASGAKEHLQLAVDLDQLRFRCDSRINAIIRNAASGSEAEKLRLVDAAERFHEQSSPGVSGRKFFYEHVHLKFEGNYLLARLLAEQIDSLLPQLHQKEADTAASWPTIDECADRLAWTEVSLLGALEDVLGRLSEPPFTAQLNHERQFKELADDVARIRSALPPTALQAAVAKCRQAADASPNDPVLQSQLALLLAQTGDNEGAYRAALTASQLLPHDATKLFQLGLALGMLKRDQEAINSLNAAVSLEPDNVWIRHELAKALIRVNRKVEALEQLRQAVRLNRSYGPAYLTMGLIYEDEGKSDEAKANYRLAAQHRVRSKQELVAIADVCFNKGLFEEATACYLDAIRLAPADPALHLGAAQSQEALGRHAEAQRHFQQVITLAPQSAQARYRYGVHLAKREEHARAAEQFEAAAQLDPSFLRARIDFGMALIATNRLREALTQFDAVLARDPTNKTGLEYKAALEKELGLQPGR
jgi:tetratricopeptide (TPR) repeat protein